jgi:phage gp29-like protein
MTTFAPKTLYQETAIDLLVNQLFQREDTDETLKKLGVHRKELRVLESDDEIFAAIETRREALVATPWRLEPNTSRQAKFIEAQLKKQLVSIIRGCFDAVLYGYSVQEVIYRKTDDGKIGLESVSTKPSEWFEPKSNGELIYRSMLDPVGSVVDKTHKFLLTLRNETYRQPYGEALLSRLYFPWLFRVQGWKFWAKNLERTGTPFLKGSAPNEITQDGTPAVDHLATVLNAAVGSSTLALPDGWTAEFMSVQQNGATFEQFETAIIKRIQKVILGQTLTSDVGKSGSFAAAKVHQSVLDDRRKADIRLTTDTVQTLVNALHSLNGFTGEPPVFVLEDDTGLETERADRDAKLTQAGVLKLTPDYLLRVYDFQEGDFEIPPPPAAFAAPPPTGEKDKNADLTQKTLDFAASNMPLKFTPDQQIIEDLADNVLAKLNCPISKESIFNAIRAAKDYDDLADRLAVLFVETDTSEFRTVLERATFAADLMGYANNV